MEEQVRRSLNLISGEDLAASVPPGTQAGPREGSDLELLGTPAPEPSSRCPIGEPVTLTVIRGLERLDLRVRPREAKA
jgi:hypothetical protein